jgi:type VI secretion system protein ImpH
MAGTDRTAASALAAALAEGATRFDFFQALRLLECAHAGSPRLGRAKRAEAEPVRLGQEPHVTFAPSSLAAFREAEGERPARLSVRLLGLFGPSGPLPLHMTVHALERLRQHHDPTFAEFCDVFHHRLLALYYRAWADVRPTVHADRPERDRFALYVGALAGLGLPSLRDRDAVPDRAKLRHAGLLGQHSRHPDRLAAFIGNVLELPVAIEELIGQWLELPVALRCRLGTDPATGTLGRTAVVGTHSWQRQFRFCIVLGPLSLADFERLLPAPGSQLRLLLALVRGAIGDELAFDVRLVLRASEVPAARLGAHTRLGWTAWLGAGRTEVADDLVLDPMAQGGTLH